MHFIMSIFVAAATLVLPFARHAHAAAHRAKIGICWAWRGTGQNELVTRVTSSSHAEREISGGAVSTVV